MVSPSLAKPINSENYINNDNCSKDTSSDALYVSLDEA